MAFSASNASYRRMLVYLATSMAGVQPFTNWRLRKKKATGRFPSGLPHRWLSKSKLQLRA
jgi:hypothetical protein